MPTRRRFLRSAAALSAAPLLYSAQARAQAVSFDPPRFDYAWLKGRARTLATEAYRPPAEVLPIVLTKLSRDAPQSIRFRRDHALWADQPLAFRVQFFHLGRNFREPVQMHEVVNGASRKIGFDPGMFDYAGSGVDPRRLPRTLDFAGFRLNFYPDWERDIAAFLGASYFRAVGADKQYGVSARGLAIDTGLNHPEEFPAFTHYWFERPLPGAVKMTIHALLDSPSITGAYRFELTPGEPLLMDIDAALYPRKAIERLGIAPLTSMYQSGENDHRVADDWRPEVHDSDGLSLWTGANERIWRPLVNPAALKVNSFIDNNPKGFGLLQRDRVFDHYQDDALLYEKRPSVWIEPRTVANQGWGRGAVQLVEIPAVDETADNIVSYWNPGASPQPGNEMLFAYRLHWGAQMPFPSPIAQVLATRDNIGGIVGQPRKYFSWRFVVDFTGGNLASLPGNTPVEPVLTASRGSFELVSVRPQPQIGGHRAIFDLKPSDLSTEPIDLRLYLRLNGQALSETWIYQWTPPPEAERKRWL